jgi:hypothetical protein
MRQQIYNALFKESKEVELSKIQVELNAVKEVEKQLKVSEKEWNTATKINSKINELKRDAISAYKQSRVNANQTLGKIEQLEKQAKDLGLELPAAVVQLKERAERYIAEGGEQITKLQ